MQLYIENLPLSFESLNHIQSFIVSLPPRLAYMFDGTLVYLDNCAVAMLLVSHVRIRDSFVHYTKFILWNKLL